MAVTITKTQYTRIGRVNLYDLRMVVTPADSSAQYPSEAHLPRDTMFKKLIGSVFQWNSLDGLVFDGDFFPQVSLVGKTGATQSQTTIFRRQMLTGARTDDVADLQSDEYMSGASSTSETFAKWMDEQFPEVIPPGIGIEIEMSKPDGLNENFIAFSAMLAEARDPRDLWPFIGARVGGIAGPPGSASGE